MADEGSRGAKLAMELAADPNSYLPTVQFGITLLNTFVAAFGGEELVKPLGDLIAQSPIPFLAHHAHGIALGILVVSITFLSLLLGELVPKQLALRQAESLARIVAPVLNWISIVARPFVWIMARASDAVLFVLRVGETSGRAERIDGRYRAHARNRYAGRRAGNGRAARWRWKHCDWASEPCAT